MERNPFTEITVVIYTCTVKSQYEGHSRVPENVPAMNSFHLFIGYNYVQYLLLMWKIRLPFIDSVLLYIGALSGRFDCSLKKKNVQTRRHLYLKKTTSVNNCYIYRYHLARYSLICMISRLRKLAIAHLMLSNNQVPANAPFYGINTLRLDGKPSI